MFDTTTDQLPAPTEGNPIRSTLDALTSLPEEEVWLTTRKSRETRQAYAGDVRRFMRLKVRDLHTTGGYDALRVIHKRGKRDVLIIHPETAERLRTYLATAVHGQDRDGPLFRRLTRSGSEQDMRRPLSPERVEWVMRTYTQQIGLGLGYSSHSMRITFITTALDHGAKLEDVQRTVGHADPSTTQLYDRGQFMPQKSAALMLEY
jgi:integrase/recombinase XerD